MPCAMDTMEKCRGGFIILSKGQIGAVYQILYKLATIVEVSITPSGGVPIEVSSDNGSPIVGFLEVWYLAFCEGRAVDIHNSELR